MKVHQRRLPLPPPLPPFPKLAGSFAILVGCLVLAGWALDVDVLKSVVPGLVAMNPATALCFIAAGISLRLLDVPRRARGLRSAGMLLAGLVAAAGLVKLFGIVTGWDIGFDQLLFHSQLAVPHGQPNRMAPNTATAFLCSGLALSALYLEPRLDHRVAQTFALGATVISSLAMIGYLYGVPELSGIASYIHMAFNTAAAFVVLSLGILLARSHSGVMAVFTSEGPGGAMARAQLPVAILVPIILGWLRLKGQELHLYNTSAGVSLGSVYSIYLSAVLIWLGARALDRLDGQRRGSEIEGASRIIDSTVSLPPDVTPADVEQPVH